MRVNSIIFFANSAIFSSWFFIPIFASDTLDLSEFHIGILFMVYGTTLLVANYLFGILADRMGRKRFLSLGLGCSAVTFGLQAFAWDFWSLLAVRAVAGFTIGIYPAALVAYVYEANRKMGKFSSFGSIGFGFGALAGGITADLTDIRYAFLLSAGLFVLSFLFVVRLPALEGARIRIPFFPREVIRRNRTVYLSVLLRHSGAHAVWVIYPLYLKELGASLSWIGAITFVNAGAQFLFMFFLLDRSPPRKLISAGLILSVMTFLLFTAATVWWHMLPLQVILAASWSCLYVGSLRHITDLNVERATATGMLNSIMSLCVILGAVMGGTIAFLYGKHATILAAALLSMVGLGIWLAGERVRTEDPPPSSISAS